MVDSVKISTLICITSAFIFDAVRKMWEVNKSQVKLSFGVFQIKAAIGTEAFLQHELLRFSETCEIPLSQLVASALLCVISNKTKVSIDIYPAIFLKDIWTKVIARTEQGIIDRSSCTLFNITQAVSLYVYTQCALCLQGVQSPAP